MAEKITMGANGILNVPNNPIIPFIQGDGIGQIFGVQVYRFLMQRLKKHITAKRK